MVSAAATNRVSASLPCVGALKNARRIVASGRLCPRSAEQRQHLVPDPLRWRHPAGPQAVGAGDDNVVAGVAARRLALWRRHVTHPEGLGQVANPVEEAGGVGRPIELQAREVVMMPPPVEQRLEEDLWR